MRFSPSRPCTTETASAITRTTTSITTPDQKARRARMESRVIVNRLVRSAMKATKVPATKNTKFTQVSGYSLRDLRDPRGYRLRAFVAFGKLRVSVAKVVGAEHVAGAAPRLHER